MNFRVFSSLKYLLSSSITNDLDNKNEKLIKEEWIQSLVEVLVEKPEVDIVEKIKKQKKRMKK